MTYEVLRSGKGFLARPPVLLLLTRFYCEEDGPSGQGYSFRAYSGTWTIGSYVRMTSVRGDGRIDP